MQINKNIIMVFEGDFFILCLLLVIQVIRITATHCEPSLKSTYIYNLMSQEKQTIYCLFIKSSRKAEKKILISLKTNSITM